MRKLNVSSISNTVGMPLKSGTLLHLQLAYQEAISALGSALAGASYDAAKVYILKGCVNTGAGNNYIISAGSIFYNGEIFLVDSSAFTISGPNVAVGVVPAGAVTTGLTYYSDTIADPVQFTDGVQRNVHEIRKCVIQAGLSGSGAANYLDWIDLGRRLQGSIGEIKMWVVPGLLDTYFNPTTGAGIHPYTAGWQICNSQNGSKDLRGKVPVGYDPLDSDFNNPFNNTGGEKTHILTIDEIPAHEHENPATSTGLPGNGGINYNGIPDTNEATSSVGGGLPHNNMPPYRSVLWVQRIS